MNIKKINETEIWLQDIEDRGLFFQLIAEIEACYSFWRYMRGRDDEKETVDNGD